MVSVNICKYVQWSNRLGSIWYELQLFESKWSIKPINNSALPSAGLTTRPSTFTECVFFTFRRLLFVCVARKEISERNKRALLLRGRAAARSGAVQVWERKISTNFLRSGSIPISKGPLLFNCDLLPACSQLYRELVKIASRHPPEWLARLLLETVLFSRARKAHKQREHFELSSLSTQLARSRVNKIQLVFFLRASTVLLI